MTKLCLGQNTKKVYCACYNQQQRLDRACIKKQSHFYLPRAFWHLVAQTLTFAQVLAQQSAQALHSRLTATFSLAQQQVLALAILPIKTPLILAMNQKHLASQCRVLQLATKPSLPTFNQARSVDPNRRAFYL